MIKSNVFETTQEQLVSKVVNELKHELQQAALNDQYLSKKEVMKLLGVSLSTVNNWSNNGTLQPYQLGGRVYYVVSEIQSSMVKLVKS